MPAPAVNRLRFARFVAGALADARELGMNDKDIAKATGVPASTFHRWQAGKFTTAPDLDKVQRFCAGLGINPAAALLALGVIPGRGETEPEPTLPPEIRRILRALADPNIPDSEKLIIREMLKMVAARLRQNRNEHQPNG